MPTYDYLCSNCRQSEEKIEPYSADSIQDCPKCKAKKTLIRQISAPTIVFNGAGWYKDAYTK